MTGLVVSTTACGVITATTYFTGMATSATTTATSFITTGIIGAQSYVRVLDPSSSATTIFTGYPLSSTCTATITVPSSTIGSGVIQYYYPTACGNGYSTPLISEDEKRRRARERERHDTQRIMGARAAIKRALKLTMLGLVKRSACSLVVTP